MPGHKRKYNVRFPPGRIKKIIQKDMEVGRMAMAVPVIISRALEMFLKSLLIKTSMITQSKRSRVMSISHMRQCIESDKLFDFLKELAEQASAPSAPKEGKARAKWPSHRKVWKDVSVKGKPSELEERAKRLCSEPLIHSDSTSESELFICLEAESS